jgi:hypothetical protein
VVPSVDDRAAGGSDTVLANTREHAITCRRQILRLDIELPER